jgi:conjugal transfer pilus assembly protein TraF
VLDENNRVPMASAARASFVGHAGAAKEQLLATLASRAGLWFFHDGTCPYCSEQVGPANGLVRRYGFPVTFLTRAAGTLPQVDPRIAVVPEAGRFKRLGVTFTPSVMLVIPPNGYHLIAQGFTAQAELEDRIIAVAHRQGLISEEDFERANPMRRGVLTPTLAEAGTGVNWDKPDEWVPHLREAILKTYGLGD